MIKFLQRLATLWFVASASVSLQAQGTAGGWSDRDPAAAVDYVKSLPTGPERNEAFTSLIDYWSTINLSLPPAGDPPPTISLLPILDSEEVLRIFHPFGTIRDTAMYLASPADLNRLLNDITALNVLPAGYGEQQLFPALRQEFAVQFAQLQSVPEPRVSWLVIGSFLLLFAHRRFRFDSRPHRGRRSLSL